MVSKLVVGAVVGALPLLDLVLAIEGCGCLGAFQDGCVWVVACWLLSLDLGGGDKRFEVHMCLIARRGWHLNKTSSRIWVLSILHHIIPDF